MKHFNLPEKPLDHGCYPLLFERWRCWLDETSFKRLFVATRRSRIEKMRNTIARRVFRSNEVVDEWRESKVCDDQIGPVSWKVSFTNESFDGFFPVQSSQEEDANGAPFSSLFAKLWWWLFARDGPIKRFRRFVAFQMALECDFKLLYLMVLCVW